jgi:hypothetical protein
MFVAAIALLVISEITNVACAASFLFRIGIWVITFSVGIVDFSLTIGFSASSPHR